jgi:hypothetical protein
VMMGPTSSGAAHTASAPAPAPEAAVGGGGDPGGAHKLLEVETPSHRTMEEEGSGTFRAVDVPLPVLGGASGLGRLFVGPNPHAGGSSPAESMAVMRALLGSGGGGVRCFVSLLSRAEVVRHGGGGYQHLVQAALDEVEPEAEPLPCAQANVEDCFVGVVRWKTAASRLGQCAAFVLEQLRAGTSVYLHCVDGRGRTSVVAAAVLGILGGISAECAIARAEGAYRWCTAPQAAARAASGDGAVLTHEEKVMVGELLRNLRATAALERARAAQPVHPSAEAFAAELARAEAAEAAAVGAKGGPCAPPGLTISAPRGTGYIVDAAQAQSVAPRPSSSSSSPSPSSSSSSSSSSAAATPPEQASGPRSGAEGGGERLHADDAKEITQRWGEEEATAEEERELEKLREARRAELQATRAAELRAQERRFEAYEEHRRIQDERAMLEKKKGLVVEPLPPWARSLAR